MTRNSRSVSGEEVRAVSEFFYWVVTFVKGYNPCECWTSNSLTTHYKKAHPMHVGHKSWIGYCCRSQKEKKGANISVPQIMSSAHPNAAIHSDDLIKYKSEGAIKRWNGAPFLTLAVQAQEMRWLSSQLWFLAAM